MKNKFVVFVFFALMIWLIATPALALKPSKTLAAKGLMAEAASMLASHDYDRLEKTLQKFLTTQEKIEDGQLKFHIFMDGIDGNAAQYFNDEASVDRSLALVTEWSQKRPKSKFAKTALANAWISRAFLSRGKKAASETTEKQFNSFGKGLDTAYVVLKTIDFTPGVADPEAYMALLQHGIGSGLPAEVIDIIYTKAKAEYPSYFYITLQYLTSKFQRWNDDPNALKKTLRSLRGDPELTARAMWHLNDYGEGESIPNGKDADVVKQGFEAIESKYKSPITTNELALFACVYWNDRALFNKVNSKIKTPDFDIWRKPDYYESCVNGTFGRIPQVYGVTTNK